MKKQLLSYSDISALCLELSLFMHAGADAGGALILLSEESVTPNVKTALLEMARQIDSGLPLSDAMDSVGLFPKDAVKMLRVGEKTGRSEETLRSLAEYYDYKDSVDRELRSSLLYPSILMAVMLSVIVVLLTKVLPIFSDVYSSLGGQMTGIAGGLLRFGQVLDSILPAVCVFIGIAALFIIVFAVSQGFRSKLGSIFAKINKRNAVHRKNATAQFAKALEMCLCSGLAPREAVETVAGLLPDISAANDCLSLLADGESLADALKKSGILPLTECRLLSIGIASGNLESVAAEIARRLDKDAKEARARRMAMIEPAMVIITSLLIGLILLTVLLPLSHIMSSIG